MRKIDIMDNVIVIIDGKEYNNFWITFDESNCFIVVNSGTSYFKHCLINENTRIVDYLTDEVYKIESVQILTDRILIFAAPKES